MKALTWKRDGADWLLLAGKRRMGRVVPDGKYAGMWRSTLSGGRLSDMANIAWAKNAVLLSAERELEFEDRQRQVKALSKCPEKRGVFGAPAPRTDLSPPLVPDRPSAVTEGV
jgi:hypothetical protein